MPLEYAGALMLHETIRKQIRSVKEKAGANRGRRKAAVTDADENGKLRMTETRIYVGLNDSETREQKYDTGKYLGLLKEICRNYHVAFSVDVEEGGYYHDDGEYTEETTLVLVLIDTDREKVNGIAGDLCAYFRQESVLVTEDRIDGRFIYEKTIK